MHNNIMTLYMPLFRACTSTRTLTQLHAHLVITGLHRQPQASTKLIESYAQKGLLTSSTLILESFLKPDSFMWGVLIKCHVRNGFFQESIFLYHKMLHRLNHLSSFIFPSILKACSAIGDMGIGQNVHGSIIKLGFVSDPVVETALLSMYGEMGGLHSAQKIFDEMLVKDVVSWSSIVCNYVKNGESHQGLEIFRRMVEEGVEVDAVCVLSVIEACGELRLWRLGKLVHGYIVKRSMLSDGALESCLIAMYGKCGDLITAERVFRNAVCTSTSSWTAMISCYNQAGNHEKGLRVFIEMIRSNVVPNEVTLMSVISSCARLGWLREGKSIHSFVTKNSIGFDSDLLRSAMIDLYANCGKVKDCYKIFDPTIERHVVSWNLLISGYLQEDMWKEALTLFVQMLMQGILPDSFSLASVISACGDVGFLECGSQIHGYVIKTGISNEFVQNSLIDMYSKCQHIDSAYLIFDETRHRGAVTWNSMMCGFSQNGYWKEAIRLFDEMYATDLEMNEVTFLSSIQACSNLGYLDKGTWIHHKLITCGIEKDLYIDTALTDMYAKCGDLQMARRVFDSMLDHSMVSWSTMIDGYGMHGHVDAAISLFRKMIESGIRPNDITFMSILSACSHAGYLEEGKFHFNMMAEFGIQPKFEHFACLVDLLSRGGDLTGAYEVIKSMPFKADISIWGALVNGCRIHQRMDIIKNIQKDLENISTDDTGYYTLLSNIYAEGEDWEKFRSVRSKMRNIGLRKVHGYSMIAVDKKVHSFGANDTSHSETREICSLLEKLYLPRSHTVELYESVV